MFAVVFVRCVFSCNVRVFALRRRSVACELLSAWLLRRPLVALAWLPCTATEPAVNEWRGPPVALVTVKVGTVGDKKVSA